jgi:hypothetical protein
MSSGSFVCLQVLILSQSADGGVCFQIALVGQEPVLYARSVRENIAYGLDVVDDEDVQRVARMANAHSFVSEAKDGYETQVGEKGVQMSGKSFYSFYYCSVFNRERFRRSETAHRYSPSTDSPTGRSIAR